MKNTIKALGFIALIVIIGFSMLACGEDDDPNLLPQPKGRLTVNNISEHNGKYASVVGFIGSPQMDFLGMQSIRGKFGNPETFRYELIPISNGTVSIPLYTSDDDNIIAYEGSHIAGENILLEIWDKQTITYSDMLSRINVVTSKHIEETKTFLNGNLSLNWTNPTDWYSSP